jgi:flagellar basal-body rod protein FlgG
MLEGLYAAAAGMSAQQTQLDAIASNLANASTTGYRAERVTFTDLLYSQVSEAGALTRTGAGAAALSLGRSPAPAAIRETGQPLDLAISGPGYFKLKGPGGQTLLTRDGSFTLDARRQIVSAQGYLLDPPITVPAGISPSQVTIAANGQVRAGERVLGTITLVDVPSPDKLLSAGENNFTATRASGAVGPARGARVLQGVLEGSNVEMGGELAQMALTQRAYQMSGTAVSIEGQMMSIANQLYSSA